LGIDLAPDVRGNVGQVINFGRDEEHKVAAQSLEAFIEWFIDELGAGRCRREKEDKPWLWYAEPPNTDSLNVARQLFAIKS
jgi:cell wall assembly regulator SMI1